eukprot:GSMAST32.ASY1.ANO1.625.1 assembled CDS
MPVVLTDLSEEARKELEENPNAYVGADGSVYEDIKISAMRYDEEEQMYFYTCPCGDEFQIGLECLWDGDDIASCPSCSLKVRVIFEEEDLPPMDDDYQSDFIYVDSSDEELGSIESERTKENGTSIENIELNNRSIDELQMELNQSLNIAKQTEANVYKEINFDKVNANKEKEITFDKVNADTEKVNIENSSFFSRTGIQGTDADFAADEAAAAEAVAATSTALLQFES